EGGAMRTGQVDLFTRRVRKPPPAPELSLQIMVADTLRRWAVHGWLWSHFPAGEHRDHQTDERGNRYSPTGARLKRMGLQRGWSDFILISPAGLAHFLELKRVGEHLSEDQETVRRWCADHGVPYFHTDNYSTAVATLKRWGACRATVSA